MSSISAFAEVEITASFADIVKWAGQAGIDLGEMLLEAAKSGGLCPAIVSSGIDGRSTWILLMGLDSGLRPIGLRCADEDLLGKLHFDAESWVHAEQSSGRKPTHQDVIRNLLELLHGDESEMVMARLQAEGRL